MAVQSKAPNKGKGCATEPNQPHQADQATTSKPRRKTAAQKCVEQDVPDDEWGNANPDDQIMQDMAGSGASPVPFLEDMDNLLAAPRSPASDTAETQPGDDDTDAAPPWLHNPSPPQYLGPPSQDESASSTQYLEPPSRGESASSMSMQSGKRRHERSPPQQQQASHMQYEPHARSRSRSSPTPRWQQPQPQTMAANDEILHLKVELHHIKQQLQYVNAKTESEWQLGYHKGQCDGFDDAMNMFPPSQASPRTGEREPLHLESAQRTPARTSQAMNMPHQHQHNTNQLIR